MRIYSLILILENSSRILEWMFWWLVIYEMHSFWSFVVYLKRGWMITASFFNQEIHGGHTLGLYDDICVYFCNGYWLTGASQSHSIMFGRRQCYITLNREGYLVYIYGSFLELWRFCQIGTYWAVARIKSCRKTSTIIHIVPKVWCLCRYFFVSLTNLRLQSVYVESASKTWEARNKDPCKVTVHKNCLKLVPHDSAIFNKQLSFSRYAPQIWWLTFLLFISLFMPKILYNIA